MSIARLGPRKSKWCEIRLAAMFARFASLAQWKGTLTVNGRTLVTDLRKGSPRREYEWGKVYTNQQFSNLLVVRIGGQPMFTRNIKFKGCVLVELTGTVVHVGRSSLRVRIEMMRENLITGDRSLCTTGEFVMVAVDGEGRPAQIQRATR